MRCRPVAPDCSLIKSNIMRLFLYFSNQLFIFYLLFSFSLAGIAAAHRCVPEKEALGGSSDRRKLSPCCNMDAAFIFWFVLLSWTIFPDLFAFSFIFMLPRWKNWQWLDVGFDIQRLQLEGFDWLCGWVAMVKAVIKAIKAAGVGLNGSSDCLCCHKLNRKGDVKWGRMGKTWKLR